MSSLIHIIGKRFFILRANINDTYHALQRLNGLETCGREGDKHFAWVSKEATNNAQSLEDLLSAWRWIPIEDDDGNICDLLFIGEKLGDEDLLFQQIAPYVGDESFINVVDDEGNVWRWLFHHGELIYQQGKLVFPKAVDVLSVPHGGEVL